MFSFSSSNSRYIRTVYSTVYVCTANLRRLLSLVPNIDFSELVKETEIRKLHFFTASL